MGYVDAVMLGAGDGVMTLLALVLRGTAAAGIANGVACPCADPYSGPAILL